MKRVRGPGCGVGALLMVCSIGASVADARADQIQDWPCDLPLAEEFSAEDVWGGELPGRLPHDWQANAAVREVVAIAAAPENSPDRGEDEIALLGERAGADRQATFLGVFAGLLEEFNLLRGFVIEGVRDFVLRAKILEEAVEQHEAALAALPADGGADIEQRRKGYLEARFWDERNLDDALDEADFLCRRYAYLGQKLRRLTNAIQAAL